MATTRPAGEPQPPDPAWRTATVLAICRRIRADQDYGLLPVLADALADAGCDEDPHLAWLRDDPVRVAGDAYDARPTACMAVCRVLGGEYWEACRWMVGFAAMCGNHAPDYNEVYDAWYAEIDRLEDEGLSWTEARSRVHHPEPNYRPVNFDDVVGAGFSYLESDGVWVQLGSESARNVMSDDGMRVKYWDAFELVTGLSVPRGSRSNPFSCSC